MGILQSTSTQNTYVSSFWLIVLAVQVIRLRNGPTISGSLRIGASFGLALLSKGTALVFGPPLLLLPLILPSFWREVSTRLVFACAIAAVTVTLLLNAGQFHRNQALYGSVLGPGEESDGDFHARYANDVISVPGIVSNLLRNLGLQIGTGVSSIDQATMTGVQLVHGWLGIALDDPRTTWPGTSFQVAEPNAAKIVRATWRTWGSLHWQSCCS